MRFTSPAAPSAPSLVLTRREGLELLEWLGLGRPEFGALPVREIAPRCRRRLWPIARNARADMRARTTMLLSLAEAADASRGEPVIMFG